MNKLRMIAGTALMASVLAGCATVDPLTVEQTARDRRVYRDEVTRELPAERYKIAIVAKTIPHAADTSLDAFMANEVESSLANNFSNLGWFDTVDRKNGVALAGEAMLVDGVDPTAIPGAQYVLISESQVSFIAKQGWKKTAYSNKARGVQIVTDFRLIDLATKEPILVKKFRSTMEAGKGDMKTAITQASNLNAKKLARVVAARLLPEVKVLQTRGSGQYAQVAMGKNYQATPNVKIDFFTLEKDGDRFDQCVFAHGTVLSADSKKAWVEVDNYKMADVCKGHNAKISEDTDEEDSELE